MAKNIFIGVSSIIFLLIGLIFYATLKNPLKPSAELVAPTLSTQTNAPLYTIVSEQSQVSFMLGEVLNGGNKTVVGRTRQVVGQLQFDPSDLSTAQIGEIIVNARTLATDNDFRNRAIQNKILVTDQFERIIFRPTLLKGLPKTVAVGESAEFEIIGDLTIKDVTRSVTFKATATISEQGKVAGHAETVIDYEAFNIFIPNVPSVTDVDPDVTLAIDFVAME